MKILIINQHTNNFGDDAAGTALGQQLRSIFPKAHIGYVYNSRNESDRIPFIDDNIYHYTHLYLNKSHLYHLFLYILSRFIPLIPFRNSNVRDYVNLVRESDVVIVSPCGANMGIYKDWFFLIRVFIAVLENKQTIFCLNTIGKSHSILFNCIAKYVLKRSMVFVREWKSHIELRKWGIKSELGTDIVFSLKSKDTNNKILDHRLISNSYFVIIPTNLSNWHIKYRKSKIDEKIKYKLIYDLIDLCKIVEYNIILLPHLHGNSKETKILDDYKQEFRKNGISEDRILIADCVDSFFAYEQIIKNSKFVISMRYHGIIFSIKNCVPFLSLSYENKMKEACLYSGMREFDLDINYIEEFDIKALILTLLNKREQIIEKLKSRQETLECLARQPIQKLFMYTIYNNQ